MVGMLLERINALRSLSDTSYAEDRKARPRRGYGQGYHCYVFFGRRPCLLRSHVLVVVRMHVERFVVP